MKKPFGTSYAHAYDILYSGKDYDGECDFVEEVFRRYQKSPTRTVLDLGSGTGGHALVLANRGYAVTGIDASPEMVAIAEQKKGSPDNPVFMCGDMRTYETDQRFDSVIAMFAVMSYMVLEEDILQAMKTARRHLLTGGLFIFDVWFGPGVLTQRPGDRHKTFHTPDVDILRLAHPEMNLIRNTVAVHYKILCISSGKIVDEQNETHTMRYVFPEEARSHLERAGFAVRGFCPFMRLDSELTDQDWNMTVIAEAI
jgi:predicted TPR repeat methyltransferase